MRGNRQSYIKLIRKGYRFEKSITEILTNLGYFCKKKLRFIASFNTKPEVNAFYEAFPNAWSRSHRISSISSSPMLRRMKSGVTPALAICSSFSCAWVVLAGWMARLLASPTLARWCNPEHLNFLAYSSKSENSR